MTNTVGLAVAVACIVAGAATSIRPGLVSRFQQDADTTPDQAVRQVRVGGVFLVLFGLALLYAILTANGPAEFIGV